MKIDVLTLFPEMFSALNHALLGKALDQGLLQVNCVNIRDFSQDKHQKCDDAPYGGGAGMLMTPQPIHDAICHLDPEHKAIRVYMSPKGQTLNQQLVEEYAKVDHLIILCGHYEGVDQRILDLDIDREISIGDFVTSGGEYPAMVFVDCISRYIPNVLGNSDTVKEESFADGMLEYPQYTHPREFMGLTVPDVLLSGNHAEIEKWRKAQSQMETAKRRPDLLKK